MRPRPPVKGRGIVSGTGLIITGLAATLAALIFPIWSYSDRANVGSSTANVFSAETTQTIATKYGPLSVLDRDFIIRVRLAGLWEVPAGRQAEQKGTTDAVRTAGQHLIGGHTHLDAQVRDVAGKLGMPLPNEPTDQQKQWLAALTAAQGEDFDRQFANLLRLAHGKVFTVVAQVRASTRNTLVRQLADDANTAVLDHIEALEDTGFVDFDALARDMAASPTGTPTVPPAPTDDPAPAVPVTPGPGASTGYSLPPAASSPPPTP